MNQIFLGEPVQEIKNWFVETFTSWPTYTTFKFVDGTTQTKEISGTATWENLNIHQYEGANNNVLKYCQLGKNIKCIGDVAFHNCLSLTSIDIPNSVTSIGNYALSSCTSLSAIDIPVSVSSIGYGAFSFCTYLTSVNIPNSVTSIEFDLFYYCSSLISINIPNSVTSIGYRAFYGCSSLTSINIPSSVYSIGDWAFDGCNSLTSVIFEGRTMTDITSMVGYPWGIKDTSIIKDDINDCCGYKDRCGYQA